MKVYLIIMRYLIRTSGNCSAIVFTAVLNSTGDTGPKSYSDINDMGQRYFLTNKDMLGLTHQPHVREFKIPSK